MADTIRLASLSDAPTVRDIYAPYITDSPVSFELEIPSVAEVERRIAAVMETYPWLVYERDGEVAGYVYAGSHRSRAAYCWSTDVSVYIGAAHHRQGIGRTLYTSLFECLRLQGFYNAYAGITLPNAGSVGLHEAMGFSRVGVYREVGYKSGKWHDVGWWDMELQPKTTEPAQPIALSAAINLSGWRGALTAGLAMRHPNAQHPAPNT